MSILSLSCGTTTRTTSTLLRRSIASSTSAQSHPSTRSRFPGLPPNLNRPGPPPLPPKDQKEFEELVRKAAAPLAKTANAGGTGASQLLDQDPATFSADSENPLLHPDARPRPAPDFLGEENPATGERGGPKKEPLNWGAEGEWTYGGRATDF